MERFEHGLLLFVGQRRSGVVDRKHHLLFTRRGIVIVMGASASPYLMALLARFSSTRRTPLVLNHPRSSGGASTTNRSPCTAVDLNHLPYHADEIRLFDLDGQPPTRDPIGIQEVADHRIDATDVVERLGPRRS